MKAWYVAAAAAAGIVLTSTAATAAGLSFTMTSGSLSAGGTSVPSCDTLALSSSPYAISTSGTVTAVSVDVPASCFGTGRTLNVSLWNADSPATANAGANGTASLSSCTASACAVSVTIATPPGLDRVATAHLLVTSS